MKPSTRKVVTRSPARTVRVVNLNSILAAAVECESALERDFILRAALTPLAAAILHQPFRLELPGGRIYTPDFLLSSPCGRRVVVEVKIHRKLESYQPLFISAAQHLRDRGYEFVVADERSIRKDRSHQRAARLLRYLKASFPSSECDRAVRFVADAPGGLPVGTLITQARVSREVIFHLVARRRLTTGRRLMLDDAALVFEHTQHKEEDHEIQLARWVDAALWNANT